jgi:hypothetical protein
MAELLAALTEYVRVLDSSAGSTSRAEDRARYSNHLAAAALMFMHISLNNLEGLKSVVSSERRCYGWGYLSDEEGNAAERAFASFSALVEATAAHASIPPDGRPAMRK